MPRWPSTEHFADAQAILGRLSPVFDDCWADSHHSQWLFRGQADAAWPLLPRALRTDGNSYDVQLRRAETPALETQRQQRRLEQLFIKSHLEACDRQGIAIPGDSIDIRRQWADLRWTDDNVVPFGQEQNWPPPELIPILVHAQHAGVPTRLLDWTTRPDVAAYFAASSALALATEERRTGIDANDEPPHVAIWALLVPTDPNEQVKRRLQVVRSPTGGNATLAVQQGVLTLQRPRCGPDENFDRATVEDLAAEANVVSNERLLKLTVLRSEVGELLRLLRLSGVCGATMFPDRSGLEQDVREQALGSLLMHAPSTTSQLPGNGDPW